MTVVRHVDGLFRRKLGGEIDIIHTARTADRPFSGTIKICIIGLLRQGDMSH